jgi:hypothetical protein
LSRRNNDDRQQLPNFAGTGEGSVKHLSMNLVIIPHSGAAQPPAPGYMRPPSLLKGAETCYAFGSRKSVIHEAEIFIPGSVPRSDQSERH